LALLFYSKDDDAAAWRKALLERVPGLDFRIWPETGDLAQITMALVWLPPPGLLQSLPNLQAIFSLGAGVDGMLAQPDLPDVPLCRLVDRSLTTTMSEFVLANVLYYHRDFDRYAAAAAGRPLGARPADAAGGAARGGHGPGRARQPRRGPAPGPRL
jgi:glyoxylate/hydroxypyruvate reductase